MALAVLDAMHRGAVRAGEEQLPARTLAVTPVGTDGVVFAGSDSDGCYTLAIVAATDRSTPAPIRMTALSVEFGVRYVLDHHGAREEVRVTVLRCNSLELGIRDLFGSFAEMLLAALPNHPSEGDIAVELGKWLGLFWRLQAPPRTDVVGLIGELTLLRISPSPSEWVRAWHGDPTSTIDFVFADPSVEVEVKATRSASRIHSLSGDQAFGDGTRYFASVHVDLRDSGGTIGDFVREIVDVIDRPDDLRRFWNTLATECGSIYAELMAERFVWRRSTGSIAFFRRDDIPLPTVTYPLPAGVTGLRLSSDFSSSPSTSADEFFENLNVDTMHGEPRTGTS